MVNSKAIITLALTVYLTMACDYSMYALQSNRAERAEKAKGDIVIGIVETSVPPNLFMKGINLAVKEINQKGGVLGRKIRTIKDDDKGVIKKGQSIAKKLSSNPDVVAVVGHLQSKVAIPVSITYVQNGIFFLTPGASHPLLTRSGAEYILRNIPTDREIGLQLAEFARDMEYKAVAVFDQNDKASKLLTDSFLEHAAENGVKIVSTRSFFSWQRDFRPLLSNIKEFYKFDCIFIAGLLPSSGHLIKQARDMGITVPVLANAGLDSPSLLTIAGRAAEGTTVATFFNPELPRKETQDFVHRFQEEFGFGPDTWAAQGYDAISLLAYAIEESGSTVPIVLTSTLKFLTDWEGVTGSYSFTPLGDIIGKSIFLKTVRNQDFVFLKREGRKNLASDHLDGEEEKIRLFNYAKNFTLRIPVERAIPNIDPGLAVDTVSVEVIEQLFLGLTGLDPDTYQPVSELATSWTVSEDGRTYTFYLRSDAKWTNGESVTADDVVWAVRRNVRLAERSARYMLRIVKNAEAIWKGEIKNVERLGIYAPDKFTVIIELEHAASYFPTIAGSWAYYPLPKNTVLEHKERWTDPDKIQTNGSYKLALWQKGVGMVLTKNPTYYDAANVSIPEIRYFVIPQSTLGLAMYENDELDIMGSGYLPIPSGDIHRIQANPVLGDEYSSESDFCTYAYVFNTSSTPVDHPLVRRAISAALNRQLMIDALSSGNEQIATTYTRPPVFGSVDPKEGIGIEFNPRRAQQWLAEAGFPDGKGLPAITLLYSRSETHSRFAHAVKASLWHFLNIRVDLLEKKWGDYYRLITQMDAPHMFLLNWCADYPDAHSFLYDVFNPTQPFVHTAWNNAVFVDLLAKAEKETDPQKRKAYYKRAEQILCEEDAVVVPIFFSLAHGLVKPKIGGWYHMPIGGQHIRNWFLREQ